MKDTTIAVDRASTMFEVAVSDLQTTNCRGRVLESTQPQSGHSHPTSSRSTTASVSPLSRRPTAIYQTIVSIDTAASNPDDFLAASDVV
jgi:hypothetical protein